MGDWASRKDPLSNYMVLRNGISGSGSHVVSTKSALLNGSSESALVSSRPSVDCLTGVRSGSFVESRSAPQDLQLEPLIVFCLMPQLGQNNRGDDFSIYIFILIMLFKFAFDCNSSKII